MPARGWTCYTSRGQTAVDHLVDCLYRAAALWLPGHKLRKDYSDDCLFLESDEGRRAIVALHVEGIINYVLKRS
jgi:N-acetylmuramoyl-L-alanine amidase